jgi:cyclopropane fatty-acyl-phospholipid synthase-like methyltransferase
MLAKYLPQNIKKIIKNIFFREKFKNSAQYWQDRYKKGGNSGTGSYNLLAEFKAEIINDFVKQQNIETVVEFGCGDGNQLKYYNFKKYLGYDVSEQSIKICKNEFKNDSSKVFKLASDYAKINSDLNLSIDVIYHLVEDDIYDKYMQMLFDDSSRFVIIYSSNTDINPKDTCPHVLQRKFTDWIERNKPNYSLFKFIQNKYPYNGDEINSSISDFYIYQKK